jgi:carotenoid cleavage dioxygenase
MGAWSDGDTCYIDMDGGEGNQFPFFPSVHEPFDPQKAVGRIRRFKINLANRRNKTYEVQAAYPEITGVLARQDDRFHTVPYRYGFINSVGPGGRGWVMLDHQKLTTSNYSGGPDVGLAEMTFVPRNSKAAEGDGYLLGIANHRKENGRSDLLGPDRADQNALPGGRAGAWILGAGGAASQGSLIPARHQLAR